MKEIAHRIALDSDCLRRMSFASGPQGDLSRRFYLEPITPHYAGQICPQRLFCLFACVFLFFLSYSLSFALSIYHFPALIDFPFLFFPFLSFSFRSFFLAFSLSFFPFLPFSYRFDPSYMFSCLRTLEISTHGKLKKASNIKDILLLNFFPRP